jgi:hypothetical protein
MDARSPDEKDRERQSLSMRQPIARLWAGRERKQSGHRSDNAFGDSDLQGHAASRFTRRPLPGLRAAAHR